MPFYLTPNKTTTTKNSRSALPRRYMTRKRSCRTPSAFKPEEIRLLRDQISSNLERAWEITGRSEDELTGVMVQISQIVSRQFRPYQ